MGVITRPYLYGWSMRPKYFRKKKWKKIMDERLKEIWELLDKATLNGNKE